MIINCDYCGARIDINKYKVCPHCGANYSEDQELKNTKKHEQEINELKLERERLETENQRINHEKQIQNYKNFEKTNKIGMALIYAIIIPIICAIICCCLGMFASVIIPKKEVVEKNTEKIEEPIFTEEELIEEIITEEEISVQFNEVAKTSKYSVIIDDFKDVTTNSAFRPTKGYIFVAFNFVVENISNSSIYSDESIYCLVDGIMMDSYWVPDVKELKTTNIPSGMKIDGTVTFAVPEDATEFEIRYGDYITIIIPNTLN